MPLVIDVSAILSLAFQDEDGSYATAAMIELAEVGAVVPTLFWFELRNGLVMGERRNRIDQNQVAMFLAAMAVQSIEVDQQPNEGSVFSLARQHRLTFYDASYLELAQRRQLPLATLDRELQAAAPAAGVTLWQQTTT